MTRTPDEIMRGLNDPISVHFHIGDPEPRLTPLAMVDLEELHADALALIQQLQDDNAQQARCIENMTDKLNAMNDEAAKLQAERDAAVADMRQASIYLCCACKKYHHAVRGVSNHYCEVIGERADFTGAISCGMFEWRGVTKEE